MGEEPEKALDTMAEDQQRLAEGLEAEVREDMEKAKGGQPNRPWWKFWART
jgi:hypothetical protein